MFPELSPSSHYLHVRSKVQHRAWCGRCTGQHLSKKMNVSRYSGSLKQMVPLVKLVAILEGVLDTPCPQLPESGPSCLQQWSVQYHPLGLAFPLLCLTHPSLPFLVPGPSPSPQNSPSPPNRLVPSPSPSPQNKSPGSKPLPQALGKTQAKRPNDFPCTRRPIRP